MTEDGKEAHLSLPFAGEFSMGYQWVCPVCKEELRSEKSQKTNWQTWYFTRSGQRHYKSRCNLVPDGGNGDD